jgi:putative DNA primase/helicase
MQTKVSPTDTTVKNSSSNPDPAPSVSSALQESHWREIVAESGVSETIATLNFWSITDPSKADSLLNRNNKKRWQHSDELVPAWAVAGIDPETSERWDQGLQLKPDISPLNKDGKPQKYLGASGYESTPLFLDTGDSGYWSNVLGDRSIPILITEGAKKAGCLLSLGYAAVSLPGVWNAQLKGRLKTAIKKLCGVGRTIYLVFDSDQVTKPDVQRALDRLGRLLAAEGCVVSVVHWDIQYKGIDDFVVSLGAEAVKSAIVNASTFEEWRSEPKKVTADQQSEPKDHRPIIQLRAGQVTQALSNLARHLGNCGDPKQRVYLQGSSDGYFLSRVLPAAQHPGVKARIELPKDVDMLDILTADTLQYEFNRRFRFERFDRRSNQYEPCDCPKLLATQFLAMGRWPNLPRLTGISYIPLLLKDGVVIREPGYHPETGMLLQFDGNEFSEIPSVCTEQDAMDALATLKDWLKEFPFQRPEHESAALSAILTAVCRKILAQAPLHALSATKAGTGKGTLVKGISTLVLGSHCGVIPWTGDSEEFRKKVVSFLKVGSPIASIDNVTGVLGGDVLEMILTEPFYKDRLLGGNQMPSFSTQVTLLANGNNLRFRPDMTRRTILCVLDAECESPEQREFDRDFEAFTEQNRGRLVMAALIVLKSYIDCGRPEPVTPRLGSFGQWSDLVRSALVWLKQPDPVETQQEISAQDDEKQLLSALLTVWYEVYGSVSHTSREVISRAINQGSGDLREVLLEICLDRSGELSPRRLGNYLRVHNRSVVNGMRFEMTGKDRTHQSVWRVMTVFSDRPDTEYAEYADRGTTTQNQGFTLHTLKNPEYADGANEETANDETAYSEKSRVCTSNNEEIGIPANLHTLHTLSSVSPKRLSETSDNFEPIEVYLSRAMGWQNGARLIRRFESQRALLDKVARNLTFDVCEVQLSDGTKKTVASGQVRRCESCPNESTANQITKEEHHD